jgi:hypothetical protein
MTTTRRPLRPLNAAVWAAAVAQVLSPAPARAADPAGEVLRLVPPNTSICLVVRGLRTHLRAIEGSPFEKWLEQSPLGKRLTDPAEVAKIEQLETFLKAQFGVGFDQLLDDVIGDAVVLAYQPGPPGQPEAEAGVVFVNARKPDLLARLVEKLNDFQKKTGEIKSVRPMIHQGQRYFEREKAGGDREYYLVRGGILAFSGQEKAIRDVIEQDAAPPDQPSRVATGIAALGLAEHCAVCWFDPRGFDADLAAKADATTDDGERAFLKQFAKVWEATDGLALYAQPGRGLELGVVARFDREKLPKEVRELAFSTGGSALWASVPEDAFLAVGGRIDVPRLLAGVEAFLPADGRAGLKKAIEDGLAPVVGRDKLSAVLAGLGPDWAVWVTPPSQESGAFLPEWTAALKLTGGKDGVDVGRTVLQAVDFAAQMARFAYNREHADQIELTEESRDGVTVKVLSNAKGFPAGYRPSYGLKSGYLVVASSPDGVHRFQTPTGTAAGADAPLMRFSLKHLRGYLETHREAIVEAAARWSGKPAEQIEYELGELSAVLAAFDKVELRHAAGDGRVRMSLHVEFVAPLAK